jgi:molybdate transport system ATP-binding protein
MMNLSGEQHVFLKLSNLSLKIAGERLIKDISFELKKGEALAITGASGSGKTLLGKLLAGQIAASSGKLVFQNQPKRLMVDQQDHFIFFSGRRSMHYGQRYESSGMENVPTVKAFLQKFQPGNNGEAAIHLVMEQMEIAHLAGRKILELSNGERKRVQLATALLQKPDLLVLDQPFVGLDFHSREKLDSLLELLAETGICLVIICDPKHIPAYVHWVAELKDGALKQFTERENYRPQTETMDFGLQDTSSHLFSLLPKPKEAFGNIVLMRQVNVKIGEKQILDNINWQVKAGEQWALLGPNGAGKTTLLSLITADNPQGYNNHLILFDRQRGSGESIWDIKQRIGFVSPELHLYFLRGAGIFNTVPGLSGPSHQAYSPLTCLDVALSGFRDEVGSVSPSTDHQRGLASAWLSILKIDRVKKRLFIHVSLGEQRLVLLARALVKSPALLILDEPCQGLDHQQTARFTQLLDTVCRHLQTTLIYVTHHPDEIPVCANHLLELENGPEASGVKYCGEFRRG